MSKRQHPHAFSAGFSTGLSKSESEKCLETIFAELRGHGLKLTPPRKLILSAMFHEHGPFSAEDLSSRFTKKNCDLATVYRTLSSLEETKMIRRCEFGDGIARYELAESDLNHHHHHMICNQCKKVEVLDLAHVEESIDRAAKKSGFKGISHILEFFGICPDCQA